MLHRLSEIQTVVKQESSYITSINFKGWWRIDEHTKTSSGLYLSSDNDNRIVSKTKYEVVWKGEMPSGVLAYELNKEFRIYFRDLNPTALPLYMWLNGQRLFFYCYKQNSNLCRCCVGLSSYNQFCLHNKV